MVSEINKIVFQYEGDVDRTGHIYKLLSVCEYIVYFKEYMQLIIYEYQPRYQTTTQTFCSGVYRKAYY